VVSVRWKKKEYSSAGQGGSPERNLFKHTLATCPFCTPRQQLAFRAQRETFLFQKRVETPPGSDLGLVRNLEQGCAPRLRDLIPDMRGPKYNESSGALGQAPPLADLRAKR